MEDREGLHSKPPIEGKSRGRRQQEAGIGKSRKLSGLSVFGLSCLCAVDTQGVSLNQGAIVTAPLREESRPRLLSSLEVLKCSHSAKTSRKAG